MIYYEFLKIATVVLNPLMSNTTRNENYLLYVFYNYDDKATILKLSFDKSTRKVSQGKTNMHYIREAAA